jgi:hypothetical protein
MEKREKVLKTLNDYKWDVDDFLKPELIVNTDYLYVSLPATDLFTM